MPKTIISKRQVRTIQAMLGICAVVSGLWFYKYGCYTCANPTQPQIINFFTLVFAPILFFISLFQKERFGCDFKNTGFHDKYCKRPVYPETNGAWWVRGDLIPDYDCEGNYIGGYGGGIMHVSVETIQK